MPVTIKPAGHGAEKIPLSFTLPRDSLELLKASCQRESEECKEMMQSSFGDKLLSITLRTDLYMVRFEHTTNIIIFASAPKTSGLPFSLFVNAHAEELRGLFVAHEGKKELVLKYGGTRYTVDFGRFAKEMGELIEKNVVDPELRRWIMPAFTTTTKNDLVVASILLMGTTQKYFDYTCCIMCGLPSVTLLGNKEDWELILMRLEKLKQYGEEPTQFCNLLQPVVSRFVKSFDNPTADETTGFWQRIAHYSRGGSGPSYYSGWITAFCFWDKDGKSMYRPHHSPDRIADNDETWYRLRALKLDGMVYHSITSDNVPPGYASVPVKVNDNGTEFQATMIAGSVATRYISSEGSGPDFDTIQPESGWWMFEKKEAK